MDSLKSSSLEIFGGIWSIFIGRYIVQLAQQSYLQTVVTEKLSKITVGDVMSGNIPKIPVETSVSNAIRNYFMLYSRNQFLVVYNYEIVGIITKEDIKKVPPRERNQVSVGQIMKKYEKCVFVDESRSAKESLKILMSPENKSGILMVRDSESQMITGYVNSKDFTDILAYI
jgi:predicted transcriptional regulator